jgi:hypothetical protein
MTDRAAGTPSPGASVNGTRSPGTSTDRTTDGAGAITQARRGQLVLLSASAALGLCVVVAADALNRSTRSGPAQGLFWLGLIIIFVPIVLRLLSGSVARAERVSLVLVLGLSLYLVKVAGNPFGFTFADELAHAPNANAILRTHGLYSANPILPVTRYYPGLEAITAALAAMSGLSTFGAGLIVIGAARVVMMLALYLLFETLSGSATVAGLAAAVYVANSNFLFFDAQFSYESLALPLLVTVVFAFARWRLSNRPWRWAAVIGILTLAITVTHHVTSYALCGVLAVLSLATFALHRHEPDVYRNPWPFVVVSLAAIVAWVLFVARSTLGYLSPVLSGAATSAIHTLTGASAPRAPFHAAGRSAAPLLERVVGVSGVVLMAIALPFGLRMLKRRYGRDPLVLLLRAAAAAFFVVLLLRLAPAAWETANRASEFLFVGLALPLAYVALRLGASARAVPVAAALGVVFAGGVISGWARGDRLSEPYYVRAGSAVLRPEGRTFAAWAHAHLPLGARAAASESDARLLATYAGAYAVAGSHPDVRDLLQATTYDPWQRELLRKNEIRFVVVARRKRSFDNTAGYYFGLLPPAGHPDALYPSTVAWRFDRAGFSRIYDSGTLIAYDREDAAHGATQR